MGSWIMRPRALDPGYRSWITSASNMSPMLPITQRERAWGRNLPIPAVQRVLTTWKGITPNNQTIMQDAVASALEGDHGPPFAPWFVRFSSPLTFCLLMKKDSNSALNHPSSDWCTVHLLKLWPTVARWSMPVYAALHIIPPLVLRRRAFLKECVL